jgi:ADP-dependent NAD(P)H-hydrate dehydratase / NAD(P)H-hydrate epimerase
MRVIYPSEMMALDRAAIESGIPSIDLMEKAGRSVAEQARDMLSICAGKRITVVVAKGNNGGDGFVAARYLMSWGAAVKVFLLGKEEDLTPDSAANCRLFIEGGGNVEAADAAMLRRELPACELVIDALFGVGFRGSAEGEFGAAIETINASSVPVLSVDVPSGIEADSGKVRGPAVDARRTVTFAWPKLGLYLYPGAEKVGELMVADIGIPHDLLDSVVESDIHTIEESRITGLLPRRSLHAHKGMCGRVLVVAGSEGFTGAAALCSRSALRTGAGVVTLGIPSSLNPILETKLTEVMTLPLPDHNGKCLGETATQEILEVMESCDTLALGPGLGTAQATRKVVGELLTRVKKPIVLDADGINCVALEPDSLKDRNQPIIITPHPGELGRLLGKSGEEIQASRLDFAQEAANTYGCVVILKGANTLVVEGGGGAFINPLALPGLATAGSGDVLTGCTATFCAQGLPPLEAALCGVYVHGKAAELAAHLVAPIGMVAGDVVANLPLALSGLLRENEGGWNI